MTSISTAYLKSRPQRIVFMIDPSAEGATDTIIQFINFANKSWGGGYYPIVPTDGKKIDAYWRRLLYHYDPDIVCTTLNLDSDLISSIHQKIVPCRIVKCHGGSLIGLNPISCFIHPIYSFAYHKTL